MPCIHPERTALARGCLFNLRLDRTEHREFSAEQPEIKARMARRMAELVKTKFQTSANYTGGYDDCASIAAVVDANNGFVGPCCACGQHTCSRNGATGHYEVTSQPS